MNTTLLLLSSEEVAHAFILLHCSVHSFDLCCRNDLWTPNSQERERKVIHDLLFGK